ncbi:unnamed protein product [Clonostachys chloroleuca]|uniref:Uncharacterized protein n=1 Tax=Clonostachys chloroleuca TaxID=1926264 RepID=A0AA35MA92_9HYPO|nr:unnamed protein product [Clonostachys chloroleuca]
MHRFKIPYLEFESRRRHINPVCRGPHLLSRRVIRLEVDPRSGPRHPRRRVFLILGLPSAQKGHLVGERLRDAPVPAVGDQEAQQRQQEMIRQPVRVEDVPVPPLPEAFLQLGRVRRHDHQQVTGIWAEGLDGRDDEGRRVHGQRPLRDPDNAGVRNRPPPPVRQVLRRRGFELRYQRADFTSIPNQVVGGCLPDTACGPRPVGEHVDEQHVGLEVVQHGSVLVHLGQKPAPMPAPVAVEQPRLVPPHEGRVDGGDGSGRDEVRPRQADAGLVVGACEPDDVVAAEDEGLGGGLHRVAVAGWEVGVEEDLHLATWIGLLHRGGRGMVFV